MTFKQKFENFFYYYKWHTIAAAFVIFIIIVSIVMSSGSYEPDLNMIYVSDKITASDTAKNLEKSLSDANLIKDANGDGHLKFLFEPMIIDVESENADPTMLQKLQVYMIAGSQSVMFLHQYIIEDYDGCFEDLSEYAKGHECIKGKDGYVTGISLKGNKYLEELGINTDNLYLAVKMRSEKDVKKGKLENEYKLAHKVVKHILKK